MNARFIGAIMLALFVAGLAPAIAQLPGPTPDERQPMMFNFESDDSFAPSGTRAPWSFETSLDKVVVEDLAEEQPVRKKHRVSWMLLSILAGAIVMLAIFGALYARWLYYDNVFGREITFPIQEVELRLGGAYGGGHGASVLFMPETALASAEEPTAPASPH